MGCTSAVQSIYVNMTEVIFEIATFALQKRSFQSTEQLLLHLSFIHVLTIIIYF